ncbi:complex I subunit 5 family protein [Pseudonocardia sp. H11422]|uniref:complex I subunit 5 family protein n=1 Tax=Pseudonocardia sp. H11422 TaxID=2835866 RepID=UPI001BDBED1D|nr:proton-conducting transporter membrane subunit [Pseudonocardia sp. H11422]
MILSVALLVPWATGAVLVALDGRRRAVGWLAVAVLAATFALLAVLTAQVLAGGSQEVVTGGWPPGVGIVLHADMLGVVFALLSVLVLLAATTHEVLAGIEERVFPGLVLLLAGGLTGLFLTGDVFNFYVFFELAMTASYVLTAYGGGRRQLRAAMVFTAVNLLGSFIFLLSVAGTYRVTGTLTMLDVGERMAVVDPNAALLIATGFFIAFSVKLGLFPFHFWLPTVYAGSSPAVAAILSGAVANIGAYGLLRFGPTMFPAQLRLVAAAIVVLGAVSLIYGAVLAVARGDVAESLAYSAIGQVGYVLVALGVGGPVGLTAAVVYSAVNALNKTLLFLAAGIRGPLVAGAFAVGALSVAGVPPAAGFVGKLEMFRAGIVVGSVPLIVLLTLGSGLSLVYMFQMYQRAFWRAPAPAGPASPLPLRLLTTAVALLVLVAGVWPEPLLAASGRAAEGLLPGAAG